MSESSHLLGPQLSSPADLRNIVSEILQSDEFCNQLQRSIERASQNADQNISSAQPEAPPPHRISTPAEELRRLFPSIRGSNTANTNAIPSITSRRVGNNASGRRNKRKRNLVISDFKRDIVLVSEPGVTKTLSGYKKSLAYANGYAVSAATFEKTWSEQDILNYIEGLFREKLCGRKFEILIPIAGNLVKPNIPEDTPLNGTIMCHLFTQKPVYIRPFSNTEIDDFSNYTDDSDTFIHDNQSLASIVNATSLDNIVETVDSVDPSCDNITEIMLATTEVSNEEIEQGFEDDIKVAMKNSLEAVENRKTIIDVLRELHDRINPEIISQFNIYREDIFHCCLRALRRKNFSPLNKISVLFTDIDNISEGAIDMGGPTREMFRLLLNYLKNSSLFEGSEHSKNISLCNEHLESKHYYDAGRIIALSLIHGGPSPNFFSETLFAYLVYGAEATKPCLDEIMNVEIREELKRIQVAPDLCELQMIVWNSTFLTMAGFSNIASFDKKETILESAPKHYLIYRAAPALEQFKEGLNILGLLEKLKEFKEFKQLMTHSDSKLTADKVSTIFNVELSEVGSNNRNVESRILTFWNDF